MKLKIILLCVVSLLVGAFGDLPSCEAAEFNSGTNEYEYLDGYNSTDASNGAYNITA
jgi:hypothetical protein